MGRMRAFANGRGTGGNGACGGGSGGGAAGMGGGLFLNGGDLTLARVVFTSNQALGGTSVRAGCSEVTLIWRPSSLKVLWIACGQVGNSPPRHGWLKAISIAAWFALLACSSRGDPLAMI